MVWSRDAGIRRMRARLAEVAAEIRGQLPRALRESLAVRFDAARPDVPVAELEDYLAAKAAEWSDLRGRLAALADADPRFADGRFVAPAVARVDFARADALLAAAEAGVGDGIEGARQRAELRAARAQALLLKGDADGAAEHIEAAAAFLHPFAPGEAAQLRHAESQGLYSEGTHAGGTGLARAVELLRRNEAIRTREADPDGWLRTQVCLALVLRQHGDATEGAAGETLLAEAVAACRAARDGYTREARPSDWAMAGFSLGEALMALADRSPDPAPVIAEALAAFRAPRELAGAELPEDWAETQFEHGKAMLHRAQRAQGADPTPLFAEAAAAFRVVVDRGRATHPVGWAAAQNNLGLALGGMARQADDAVAVALFAEAVAALRAALEAFPREDDPEYWARTQDNLGLVLARRAQRTGEAAHYAEAVAAYRAAIEVYTPGDYQLIWAGLQYALGLLFEEMGDRGASGASLVYRQAWGCLDAARGGFESEGYASNEEECASHLSRVAAKLASAESGAQL